MKAKVSKRAVHQTRSDMRAANESLFLRLDKLKPGQVLEVPLMSTAKQAALRRAAQRRNKRLSISASVKEGVHLLHWLPPLPKEQ